MPWSDDFPLPGSEIHTDPHRFVPSLSLSRKKNSHILGGSLDEVTVIIS
jgi:hypothetical protein